MPRRKDGLPSKVRVVWTSREEELVADAARAILANPDDPDNKVGGKWAVRSLSMAWRLGQRVLPADRHRSGAAFNYDVAKLRQLHDQLSAQAARAAAAAEPPPDAPQAPTGAPPPTPAPAGATPPPTNLSHLEALRDFAVNLLADALVEAFRRIGKQAREAHGTIQPNGPLPEEVADDMAYARREFAGKPPRRRVDVIGLKGNQRNVVEHHAISLAFDLRFLASDQHVKHADLRPEVVLCTKWIRHQDQSRYRSAGKKIYYANGGAESVIKALMHAAHEDPPALQRTH